MILLYALLFLLLGLPNSQAQTNNQPIRIKTDLPIAEKWNFLSNSIGDKKIVCLGESLHGVKEYNASKVELIQYLHEEMGFNVLAIESDLAMSVVGNLYRDSIPDSLFLEKVFTPVWHTKEHFKLVQYLKAHPKLQLIGFDIVGKVSLTKIFQELGLTPNTAPKPIQDFIQQYAHFKDPYSPSNVHNLYVRDSVMAKVSRWIIDQLYPNSKVILYGANVHISKSTSLSSPNFMGSILYSQYPKDYYSIALFHSLGNPMHVFRDYYYVNEQQLLPKNSLQYKLLKVKGDYLFLDINQLQKKPSFKWLTTRIDHVAATPKHYFTVNLAQSYDALIWLKTVTHPTYIIDSPRHYLNKK